jgi:ribosomal protein S27AE
MNIDFSDTDNTFFNDINFTDNNNFFTNNNFENICLNDVDFEIDNIMVNVNDYCPNCGYNILHADNHDACLNCGFNKDYAIDGQTESAYNSAEQVNDVSEQVNDVSEQNNEITLSN